eukprot:scaffold1388_cov390-Prasinococcus_capsulatus_cf.AAC.27
MSRGTTGYWVRTLRILPTTSCWAAHLRKRNATPLNSGRQGRPSHAFAIVVRLTEIGASFAMGDGCSSVLRDSSRDRGQRQRCLTFGAVRSMARPAGQFRVSEGPG